MTIAMMKHFANGYRHTQACATLADAEAFARAAGDSLSDWSRENLEAARRGEPTPYVIDRVTGNALVARTVPEEEGGAS